HHAVVLRRRRLVLALDPVVVHADGAGRGAAPTRAGRRRPATAGGPGRHAGRSAAAPGGAAAEPPAGAGEGVALVVRTAEPPQPRPVLAGPVRARPGRAGDGARAAHRRVVRH